MTLICTSTGFWYSKSFRLAPQHVRPVQSQHDNRKHTIMKAAMKRTRRL